MPDYQIFGGVLRSDVAFPEMSPCLYASPRWYLSRRPASSLEPIELLGRDEIDISISVTACRTAGSVRLTFDDTGTFDILSGGRSIHWMPSVNPDLDLVRRDILGRVFAVCFELGGMLALHGSAVQMGDTAVAFLAPKFHGKSTTAAALVGAGGRLLADDLVGVTAGLEPHVMPGPPVVQLWGDSADRIARPSMTARPAGTSPKVQLSLDAQGLENVPVPLSAVYLLAPFVKDESRAIRREPLPNVAGALALLGQAKIGSLLGTQYRAMRLKRMAWLAERVPVYRLSIPRDYSRLDELTDTLQSWHAPPRTLVSSC